MATYADGSVIITIDIDAKYATKELENTKEKVKGVGDESEETGEKVGGLGDETDKTGLKMAALSASAVVAAKKLLDIGSAAVTASTQFDSAFAKTQTIMDTATMAVSDMRSEILSLSQDSAMVATDVSEAVYQAISGSVATEDAVTFVEQSNKLAVAGFTDLTSATDVLTTTLNSYKLEASAVGGISNVLIQTQNLGKTSVNELSASMGRAISTGSAYGVNLQNIATTYVELTRSGIATSEATTYLSGMLNELGDSGSKVGAILQQETGRSFGQLMADGWSLGDVLQVLSDSVDGNAEALMGLWSSQEAGKASNAIMTQGVADFNDVVAQMNDEMSGATGTTEKAYQTMTNTSEFIDRMLTNSVNNLSIAFGDGLRPAVDGVKKLLTGVTDWATEFISQNPLVVSAFAALTAGIGATAIALTLYTLKTKLATLETLKLTAAMATNPIILAIAAVATLTVGIVTLATSADDAAESVEDMTTATRNLEAVVAESEAAYTSARDEIEGNAVLARQYADRLQELENQQSMTAAEAEEYRATIEKLRVVLPDLNVEIDEQTGLLKDGADALQTQIDGWYELAVAQALQEKYKEQIQAQAEAEAELYENLAERQRKEAEIAVLEDQLPVKTEQQNHLLSEQKTLIDEICKARERGDTDYNYDDAQKRLTQCENDLTQVSEDIEYLNEQLDESKYSISLIDTAIEENNRIIKENADQVDEAKNAYDYYTDSVSNASQVNNKAALAAQNWAEASEALKTAYEEAYTSARDSIDGQISLFEDMGDTLKTISSITQQSAQDAVSDYIGALDTEIAYLNSYSSNMQLAAERGIDQGILQELSDGSAESAKTLANLVNATDEQIQEMNAKWSEVGNGKDKFAESMTEYTGVIEDEKTAMVELAAQIGIGMSNALTQGLLDGINDYEAAWQRYHVEDITKGDYKIGASAYASGTISASPGLALVGENGPELVFFRGGERVLTADETREAMQTVYPIAPQMAYLGGGAPAIAHGGGIQLRAVIAVPLEIDGREFARATAEYNGEEMEWGVM
ncbi:MAG: phage tail tape measure protein [Faecousia sp.]